MREPEPDVVVRAQAGDLAAFESLVRDYQADVWRFAYHLTRSHALAEDVAQEAFLKAFRAIRTFRGEARFTTWLLRIVRNAAVDAYRRSSRQSALAEQATVVAERTAPASAGPSEERLRIQAAIRALPEQLREPFVVIEVLGFDYAEASRILGVKVGTVKSRMHRARAALVRTLSEEATGEA